MTTLDDLLFSLLKKSFSPFLITFSQINQNLLFKKEDDDAFTE